VAAEFNSEFDIIADIGQDALLVINDTNGNNFSVWQWVQGTGGTVEIDTTELTLIGNFTANGTVDATMFDIIPGG
jgi:DNA/RNA-binding domain of Phe-tRNA-synthetase-like protein